MLLSHPVILRRNPAAPTSPQKPCESPAKGMQCCELNHAMLTQNFAFVYQKMQQDASCGHRGASKAE